MAEITEHSWGDPIGELEGKPIYGGDCVGGLPAAYMTRAEVTNGRYPETEEEWEIYGHKLPEVITVMGDTMVDCSTYQGLIEAGIAVEDCSQCPLRQNSAKT